MSMLTCGAGREQEGEWKGSITTTEDSLIKAIMDGLISINVIKTVFNADGTENKETVEVYKVLAKEIKGLK